MQITDQLIFNSMPCNLVIVTINMTAKRNVDVLQLLPSILNLTSRDKVSSKFYYYYGSNNNGVRSSESI